MISGFKYSNDNKRYYTYNYYLRMTYGKKVFKVPVNLGLTCPNRDGTKGVGGCTFCSGMLSGEFAGDPSLSVRQQFDSVREKLHKKWPDALYIPYFQAGSNTYSDIGFLRKAFFEAAELENAVGVNIATRADCICEECADMLAELSEKTDLEVELGLQTVSDKTALRINRCHTYEEFLEGYNRLRRRNINICLHIINGLPGETYEDMMNTARAVAYLKPHSVKLHLLHILKGTRLSEQFLNGEFQEISRDDYIKTVCDQLEILPSDIVIARLTGDGKKDELISPMWSLKKFCVINDIDKEMLRRNSFQGIKYKSCFSDLKR